jgi:hypothetical protein
VLYNRLNVLWKAETRQGMRSVLAKMKGVTGELALILHRLNAAIANQPPSVEVNGSTMSQAIALAQYYLCQVKLIHADAESETVNGNPTGKLKKILELSERVGVVSARDIQKAIRQYKSTSAQDIRSDFLKLQQMGYGQTEGTGNRLKFKTADIGQQTADIGQQVAETSMIHGFESSKLLSTADTDADTVKKAKTLVTHTVQTPTPQTADTADTFQRKSKKLEQKSETGIVKDSLMKWYSLQPEDLLVIEDDGTGSPQVVRLKKKHRSSNTWETYKKNQFISYTDCQSGLVREPTARDIATLIKNNPNRETVRWLHGNLEGLHNQAIELLGKEPENNQLVNQCRDFLKTITLTEQANKALKDLQEKMRELGKIAQQQFLSIWGDDGTLAIQFAKDDGKIRIRKGMIEAT